jgi:hypothetical protein
MANQKLTITRAQLAEIQRQNAATQAKLKKRTAPADNTGLVAWGRRELGKNKLVAKIETTAAPVKSQAQLIDEAQEQYFAATEKARLAFISAVDKLTAQVNPSGDIRSAELAGAKATGYDARVAELRAIYDEQIGKMRDAYLAEISRIQNSGVIDPSPVDGVVHYGTGDPGAPGFIEQIKAAQSTRPAAISPGSRVGR